MTLEEFVTEERQRIDKFVLEVKRVQREQPVKWPEQLSPGEWDEALNVFDPAFGFGPREDT